VKSYKWKNKGLSSRGREVVVWRKKVRGFGGGKGPKAHVGPDREKKESAKNDARAV